MVKAIVVGDGRVGNGSYRKLTTVAVAIKKDHSSNRLVSDGSGGVGTT